MTQTTITIRDGQAWVDMPSPRAGNRLTADQSAALHALTSLAAEGVRVNYDGNPLASLAADLLNPEQLGFSVTPEVRDRARIALGMPAVEANGTEEKTVRVSAEALRQVLVALSGPGHLIRELQATRDIAKLSDTPNPINTLVDQYNRVWEPKGGM